MNGYKIIDKESFFDEIIGHTEDKLIEILKNKESAYRRYEKEKRNGNRVIYAINKNSPIYVLQNKLQNRFFANFMFPECVCGFLKRKSYFDFLIPHVLASSRRYYLRLDIHDFFGSIRIKDVEDALLYYINNNLSSEDKSIIIKYIIEITSVHDKIIQGAVTSPVLSNLVFRSLDIRIEKYCKKLDITYTRYADDMLFSSRFSYIHNHKFQNMIKTIIGEKGFILNNGKTLKYENEISLNGYVVGSDIRLSRKKLLQLNRIIYNIEKSSFTGFKSKRTKYITKNKLAGYRAFLIQTIPYINKSNLYLINKKISKIENLIIKYCMD